MFGLPLAFSAPLVLIALVALPAIWLMLRVTPPQPRRIDFPPLRILADLAARRETPARTPWWLLLLRLTLAAFIILACAGPIWNPRADGPAAKGPLLILIDNGFSAARDWRARSALAAEQIEAAGRDSRTVALAALADRPQPIEAVAAPAALDQLRAIVPQPWAADRARRIADINRFIAAEPEAGLDWISDGIALDDAQSFLAGLKQAARGGAFTIHRDSAPLQLALAGIDNNAGGLDVTVIRAAANGRDTGTVRALDRKGLALGEAAFTFKAGDLTTQARFDLPIEIRNAVARLDIAQENSAGAVALVDETKHRRRIGLVTGATSDLAQPLLSPTYYVARALGPYADVREPHAGTSEAITQLLDEKVSLIVLADVGTLDRGTVQKLETFVNEGGVLVRFAGSRLAASDEDALVPVRLRRGGRNLGGSLSWDTPKTLSPFTRESPFYGLATPEEIQVRRQILAEPDGDLPSRTWASLADGTPIVTADRRGAGLLVLFHVTADPSWSSLPLSGTFVDMLRRVTSLAGQSDVKTTNAEVGSETLSPARTLDGFGAFRAPPATAKPVSRNHVERASDEHPAGFYGPNEAPLAVNALVAGDALKALDLASLGADLAPITRAATVDLRMPLLLAASLLLLIDTLLSLMMGGHLSRFTRRAARMGGTAAMLALALALHAPDEARAQPATPAPAPQLSRNAIEAGLLTRLAYVVTGDPQVDAASKAGLYGLTLAIGSRTALEPGEPMGVDPAKDELAFYPVLYWPVVAGRPLPSQEALRKLDGFMKGGGTVIFDTRDALAARPGGGPTPEAQQLRRMLATLDIPELEPVPRDHVLTKSFYLLDNFPGRYSTGQTWVEALPVAPDGERRPARAGDGVTPIVITSNDLAAAWATDQRGEPLYPLVGGEARQREMALRAGINLVMYTLTGNYKADQVHVPALLERLGQ